MCSLSPIPTLRRFTAGHQMSALVIDSFRWLIERPRADVAYARTAERGIAMLEHLRVSDIRVDTLWLSWDLDEDATGDSTAPKVIAHLIHLAARGAAPRTNGIIVLAVSKERQQQMVHALAPWFEDVSCMHPENAALQAVREAKLASPTVEDLSPIDRLRRAGVRIEPGLSDAEFAGIESRFGFEFSDPHRSLLASGLPVDAYEGADHWPNWRHGDPVRLQKWVNHAADGLMWSIASNTFWPTAWGVRPPDLESAQAVARARLAEVPRLIPLESNRNLAEGRGRTDSPVIATWGDDLIYLGASLSDWIKIDFEGADYDDHGRPAQGYEWVPFWSSLVESEGDWIVRRGADSPDCEDTTCEPEPDQGGRDFLFLGKSEPLFEFVNRLRALDGLDPLVEGSDPEFED